jgi:hypothetical protein
MIKGTNTLAYICGVFAPNKLLEPSLIFASEAGGPLLEWDTVWVVFHHYSETMAMAKMLNRNKQLSLYL